MSTSVTFDGSTLHIDINALVDNMTADDKHAFMARLTFDQESLEMILDAVVNNNSDHTMGWFSLEAITEIRSHLHDLMPNIAREQVATARALAHVEAEHATATYQELWAWKTLANKLAIWLKVESSRPARDLGGTAHDLKARAVYDTPASDRCGHEMERLVNHARSEIDKRRDTTIKEALDAN